jgi:hypothetical protein
VVGIVTTRSSANSRRNRSMTISKWSIPKNRSEILCPLRRTILPHRKAMNQKGANAQAIAEERQIVLAFWIDRGPNDGRGRAVARQPGSRILRSDVIVSPTDAMPGFLIPVTM